MAQSSRLLTSQLTGLTTAATALAAASHASCREVVVQADPDNTTDVLIGHATAQYLKLVPGQGISIPINNVGTIYVRMESGTGTVNWLARD